RLGSGLALIVADVRPSYTLSCASKSPCTDLAVTSAFTLSLHDALPILPASAPLFVKPEPVTVLPGPTFLSAKLALAAPVPSVTRSEVHTPALQSLRHLVCRVLLGKTYTLSCASKLTCTDLAVMSAVVVP